MDVLGLDASTHGRCVRPRRVVCGVSVVGDHRPAGLLGQAVRALQCLGGRDVQPLSLTRQQVVVKGFADKRVAEPARVAVDDEQLVEHGLTHRRRDDVDRLPGHLGEQGVVDVLAEHRRLMQDVLSRIGQAAHPRQDHVGEGRWQRAGHASRGHQFLDVEGVSIASGEEVVDCGVVGGRAVADLVEQADQFGAVQAGELDVFDQRRAFEIGDQRAQRMAPVQLVAAIGEHECHRGIAQVAGEECDEVAGGRVRPVQILERDQEGLELGEAGQKAEDLLEEGARPLRSGGSGGKSERLAEERIDVVVAELGTQVTKCFDERGVRDGHLAELQAPAGRSDEAVRPGRGREFGDQPGLADAGIAGDQNDPGCAPSSGRRGITQSRQLVGSSD